MNRDIGSSSTTKTLDFLIFIALSPTALVTILTSWKSPLCDLKLIVSVKYIECETVTIPDN